MTRYCLLASIDDRPLIILDIMTRKSLTLFFSALLLFGCANRAHVNLKKPPQNAPSDDASIKLAEAANSVSESLIELARIENASFYKARIIGRKPAIPVLVGLSMKDETLANILRNVDFQIGKKADLKVYPRRKIIELRYANV